MIFSHSFRMIQRSWRLVLITVLIGWIGALFVSYRTVPLFRATATFLIFPNANLTSSRDVVTSLGTLEGKSVISTYADIMSSRRVFQDTLQKLKLDSAEYKPYTVVTNVQSDTNILELSVEGPDPQAAALLTNNIGQTGINYIKGIYQVYDIAFLDQASQPAVPFTPLPLRDGGIAAGVGLLVGILLAIFREQIRVPLDALRERAIIDRVSGAFNQRHFKRLLEAELARNPTGPTSLGLLDLDGLEDLVDALPEAVLTELMRNVTTILRNRLRGNDIVGRWSRTSFALLLPNTPGAAAERTMERVREALEVPFEIDTSRDKVNLQPATGFATRAQGEAMALLIQAAETALEAVPPAEQQ